MRDGERRQQHRVVVDRDHPLAAAHLLLQQVAQQAAAHRAGVVRREALALARDQRRARSRARRAGRACAPARRPRPAPRSPSRARRRQPACAPRERSRQPCDRVRELLGGPGRVIEARCSGVCTITSWMPVAGLERQELRIAAALGERVGRLCSSVRDQQRVLVRHRADQPARRVRRPAAGPQRPGLGRRPAPRAPRTAGTARAPEREPRTAGS